MSIQIDWDLIKVLANIGKYLIEDGTYRQSDDGDITFCVVCGCSIGNEEGHAPDCPIPPALKAWHKSQVSRMSPAGQAGAREGAYIKEGIGNESRENTKAG